MDVCPTCGTPLAENLVAEIKAGLTTCPRQFEKDLARVREAGYAAVEVTPDMKVAEEWFYRKLWNAVFFGDPLLQVEELEKPANLPSWEEFESSMDTLYPKPDRSPWGTTENKKDD